MSSFQTIETLGVSVIIAVQFFVFFRTLSKIRRFRHTFDRVPGVVKVHIPISHLNTRKPDDIITDYERYLKNAVDDPGGPDLAAYQQPEETKEIHLIIPGFDSSNELRGIITSINIYLIKNRGASSDFHLIKDVVERNADMQEGEIGHTISLPLYLGLLGTMFGIVFGLFNIADLEGDFSAGNKTGDSITILLGGVKIAMIASFTGLALTIINSGWFYKGAKFIRENRKNGFYTFIQTELLPVLNQNINSTLHSLQTNLFRFNDDFSSNIVRLNGIMNKNYDTLTAQERILSAVERLDVTEFAKANVKVLKEVQQATDKFAAFNSHLDNVNEMVAHSGRYVAQMNELLTRTDNLGHLASKIVETFELNRKLQEFLQHHYSSLEHSQQVFDEKLTGVNDVLYQTLDQLKGFVQQKIIEVQGISLKEIELMRDEYPEKWKKLDNLVHLELLNKNVADIKSGSVSQSGRLRDELSSLNEKLGKVLTEFEEVKKERNNTFFRRMQLKIRSVFKKSSPDEG
jgi:uncharacterized coiled-coil DUF342 family protein